MEVWFLIGGILAFGILDATHPDPEFFSRTHDVGADEISGVTITLPTGEVGVVTFGEEMAERLIKESRDRTVN